MADDVGAARPDSVVMPGLFQLPLRSTKSDATTTTTTNLTVPNAASQQSASSPGHRRMLSLDSAGKKRSGHAKRLSLQTRTPMPILPYTPKEWNDIVSEVKRHYVNRKYRNCSTRCSEVLTNVKNQQNVEPTYLIYLNFYAASSVEMLARPLNPTSCYRKQLLEQARDHYHRASGLISAADESIARLSSSRRCSVATTSTLSTSRLSVDSLSSSPSVFSSRHSMEYTDVPPSPTESVSSLEDELYKFMQPSEAEVEAQAAEKHVTFRDSFCCGAAAPIVRPDSPTLGFKDLDPAPRSPSDTRPVPDFKDLGPSCYLQRSASSCHHRQHHHHLQQDPYADDVDLAHLREQSVRRYCELLSFLRSQVASHLASLEEQLAVPSSSSSSSETSSSTTTTTATTTAVSSSSASSPVRGKGSGSPLLPTEPGFVPLISARPPLRLRTSSSVDLTASSPSSSLSPSSSSAHARSLSYATARYSRVDVSDELRQLEIKARIERLRATGWQRKRFDPKKYEDLRESVLAELD